jgi:hypothetical protein
VDDPAHDQLPSAAEIRLRDLVEDGFLPSRDDRAWLLKQLAELVHKGGAEHLLVAPLIDGNECWFPDPWGGGEASVKRLLRRVLLYAGIPDHEVEVTIHEEAPTGKVATGPSISPVAFEGMRDRVLAFAVGSEALRNPGVLVPAAARAVAEAWRSVRRLGLSDSAQGQRIVDVTAMYLGFGRLTLNATIQDHVGASQGFSTSRSRTRLGVLTPTQSAFVLGTVAVARELPAKEVKRLAKGLNPNPRAFFKTAVSMLREQQPPLAEVLGLPPRAQWPESPDLDVLTEPMPLEEEDVVEAAQEVRRDEDKGIVGSNDGKPVFRVSRSKSLRLAKMLALPVGMFGMLAGRMDMGIEIPMWMVVLATAGLGLVGLVVGRFFPDSRCSEPTCGADLAPEDEVCPRCGGVVSGVIAHPKERLAAEEALERQT